MVKRIETQLNWALLGDEVMKNHRNGTLMALQ